MLEVTATRKITHPEHQTLKCTIDLRNYDELTPASARAALIVAFGNDLGGEVITWKYDDDLGWLPGKYGYRISKSGKTCKRFDARNWSRN